MRCRTNHTGFAVNAAKAIGQASVWDEDCALCVACGTGLVCAACEAALGRSAAACVRCAIPLSSGDVCGRCRARAPAFDRALAAFEYRYPLDRLVQRFKYGGDLAVGRWLAEALAARVSREACPDRLLAPPSSARRLRERGFNPALEIAKVVARRVGSHCALDGLGRVRDTAAQPGRNREERRRNLRGAFRCRLDLRGEHVALVDDVMTTGATADECAAVLKAAGAARVSVWVVARTPEPHV